MKAVLRKILLGNVDNLGTYLVCTSMKNSYNLAPYTPYIAVQPDVVYQACGVSSVIQTIREYNIIQRVNTARKSTRSLCGALLVQFGSGAEMHLVSWVYFWNFCGIRLPYKIEETSNILLTPNWIMLESSRWNQNNTLLCTQLCNLNILSNCCQIFCEFLQNFKSANLDHRQQI